MKDNSERRFVANIVTRTVKDKESLPTESKIKIDPTITPDSIPIYSKQNENFLFPILNDNAFTSDHNDYLKLSRNESKTTNHHMINEKDKRIAQTAEDERDNDDEKLIPVIENDKNRQENHFHDLYTNRNSVFPKRIDAAKITTKNKERSSVIPDPHNVPSRSYKKETSLNQTDAAKITTKNKERASVISDPHNVPSGSYKKETSLNQTDATDDSIHGIVPTRKKAHTKLAISPQFHSPTVPIKHVGYYSAMTQNQKNARTEQKITIHIGRVEVRAETRQHDPIPVVRKKPNDGILSLRDYLRKRSEGRYQLNE